MKKIRLTGEEMGRVNEILGSSLGPSKIEAIKFVRTARLHQTPVSLAAQSASVSMPSTRSDISLMEAKDAVEDLMRKRGMETAFSSAPVAVIVPFQPIRRIVCDFGEGDLELDVEGMSLRILTEMGSIPIEDITSLLDLYKRVREWEASVVGVKGGGE